MTQRPTDAIKLAPARIADIRGPAPTVTFVVVAYGLLAAGWAANHFSTMLAVLREQQDFPPVVVNGAFGIYAAGLVPCLLIGGLLADRFGARPIVVTGSVAAAMGNLMLLVWQTTPGLLVGRLVVGLGVGLTISAGTAWAARLRDASGVVLAGIVMTTGFAVGPIASGIFAYVLTDTATMTVPFVVTIILSGIATVAALAVRPDSPPQPADDTPDATPVTSDAQPSLRRALATAIPMALWVFSTAAVALVTLAERVSNRVDFSMLLPGIAALLAFSAGLIVQAVGRRFTWGPTSGVAAACIAGLGFIVTGLGGAAPPLWLFVVAALLLGTAYGMALREGLLDVETYAPPHRRGTALGIYYVFTYFGFILPVVFAWMLPVTGYVMPLVVLGIVAFAAAALRGAQIRRGLLDRD